MKWLRIVDLYLLSQYYEGISFLKNTLLKNSVYSSLQLKKCTGVYIFSVWKKQFFNYVDQNWSLCFSQRLSFTQLLQSTFPSVLVSRGFSQIRRWPNKRTILSQHLLKPSSFFSSRCSRRYKFIASTSNSVFQNELHMFVWTIEVQISFTHSKNK